MGVLACAIKNARVRGHVARRGRLRSLASLHGAPRRDRSRRAADGSIRANAPKETTNRLDQLQAQSVSAPSARLSTALIDNALQIARLPGLRGSCPIQISDNNWRPVSMMARPCV